MPSVTNNVLVTPQVFAPLVLIDLRTMNAICRNMTTEISQEFAKKTFKVGDTVTVRRPYRFQVEEGQDYKEQAVQDTTMPITVDQWLTIGFGWDGLEKTLSLREANELYAKPAAIAMSAEVNKRSAKFAGQNTPNYVGTPGTAPSTIDTYLEAGTRLYEVGCPENEDLHLIVNRAMSDKYVSTRAAYFNPQAEISQMISKGRLVDRTLGYVIDRDQSIYTHTVGTLVGTPVIDASSTKSAAGGDNATMQVVVSGFNASSSSIKKGDKFTIADVYAIHPQTRESTGRLKQFTVVADAAEAGGAATLTIFPAITPVVAGDATASQYANVDAAAVTGKAVLFWAGTSGSPVASSAKVSKLGLVMNKSAFAFVAVPVAVPEAGEGAKVVSQAKDPETGMWLSYVRAFDSTKFKWINRFDTLIGNGKLYAAEECCVIAS